MNSSRLKDCNCKGKVALAQSLELPYRVQAYLITKVKEKTLGFFKKKKIFIRVWSSSGRFKSSSLPVQIHLSILQLQQATTQKNLWAGFFLVKLKNQSPLKITTFTTTIIIIETIGLPKTLKCKNCECSYWEVPI